MERIPVICKLCGESLREGFDGYSDLWQEWGSTDRGPNDPRQVPALYVQCERCLNSNLEDADV